MSIFACIVRRYVRFLPLFLFSLSISAQPVIKSFSPLSARVGETVMITGNNFSSTAAGNIVYFGAVKATVTASSTTLLSVKVPAGAIYHPISVTTGNLTAYSSALFTSTFTGTSSGLDYTDVEMSGNFTTDLHPNGVVIADFDGDGKPDLATPNNYSTAGTPATVSVLRNTSALYSISFAPKIDYVTGTLTYSLAAADIDGDGLQDLIATSIADKTVSILRNISTPGTISFSGKVSFSTGDNPNSVAVGDFNADGKPDLAVANYLSNSVSIFRNNGSTGNISFQAKSDITTGLAPASLVINDIDGDGKADLAVVNELSNTLSVFRNTSTTSNISFANSVAFTTGSAPKGVTAGDFDNDGKIDLAVSNNGNTSGIVSLFRNTSSSGSISLAAASGFGSGFSAYKSAAGDFNGDGKVDIVTPVNTVALIQFNSSSNNTFSFGNSYEAFSTNPYNPAMGDLDGDGKTDLVVPSFPSDYLQVYRNHIGEPYITGLSNSEGSSGTTITIYGIRFNGITGVSFGGAPAASFTVNADGSITAVVGKGGSGDVVVTGTNGRSVFGGFNFLPPPVIEGFSPATAIAGTMITITGKNLAYVNAVSFGGVAAASFRQWGDDVQAVVGEGASGDIILSTSYGNDTISGFTYIPPPAITSFSPATAGVGTKVTITGTDLSGATAVNFGGTPASSFTVVSPTTVTAYVAGGSTGAVTLTTQAGTDTIDGFTFAYVAPPVITSFSPEKGKIGTTVTLAGNNFNTTPSGNLVYFGATRATVLTASATQLTVQVPAGATFEPISVLHTGNHLAGVSRKPFIVADTAGYRVAENTFSAPINIAHPTFPLILQSKDMNGDGKPDLLTNNSNVLNILYNSSVSPNITIGSTGVYDNVAATTGTRLLPGDLDGDGLTDIVSTSNAQGLNIYRNTGSLASCSFSAVLASNVPNSEISDIDGDGRPDIVGAEYWPGYISVSRNTSIPGVLSFAGKVSFATDSTATSAAVGDVDNDGLPDVVAACGNGISVFRNTSTAGNISFNTRLDLTGVTDCSKVVIADLNNDDKPDLIVYADHETRVGIYKNTSQPGAVSFSYDAEYQVALSTLSDISVADINLDGKPDIVVGNEDGALVYENISSGAIIAAASPVTFGGRYPSSVALVDMDADGKSDIIYTLVDHTAIIALHNQADIPYIRSFSPELAAEGDTVMLTGLNLSGVTGIQFGGTAAASFTINSDSSITAIVGKGASGDITATSAKGNGSVGRFTFVPPLSIASFSPVDGGAGTTVYINGDGFWNITSVTFGGVPAASYTNSLNWITAVVGAGASGDVVITTRKDTVKLEGFTYYLAPAITGFTPDTAIAGNQVTITGTHFTGTTAITFGGIPAESFIVDSDTRITVVMRTAESGEVSVTTPGGTATLPGFTFIPAPVITTRVPAGGGKGTVISLYGKNLDIVTAVRYGGVPAQSFTIVSSELITTVVGNGASGATEVESPGGIGIMDHFEFHHSPVISSFTPASAAAGATVAITGSDFYNVSKVTFGGKDASSFTVLSSTSITAVVDAGASGYVSVTARGGTDSAAGFTYIPPAPVITTFTPASAAAGTAITITGSDFYDVSKVTFGGKDARSYTVLSPTSIVAVVDAGASGYVSITTMSGTDSTAGFVYIPPTPVIAAFTPVKAATGTAVTITGANFTGATQVLFGGVPALSFTVVSPDTIVAVVGAGASGTLTVTTPEGSISGNGFIYLAAEKLTLYPNPVHDKVYVKHPASPVESHITLTDRMGKLVKMIDVPANTQETEVNVKGLTLGIYEVIWTDGSNKLRQSLLVY